MIENLSDNQSFMMKLLPFLISFREGDGGWVKEARFNLSVLPAQPQPGSIAVPQ
jgi:hypothetical protein